MKNITHVLKRHYALLILLFPLLSLGQTANYDISVTTIWNTMDHTSVPGNAHWSNLIGATHNTTNEFMSLGSNATLGIKQIAERGENDDFILEVNSVIMDGRADQLLQDGFSPFAGNNSNAGYMNITVSEDFPLITLVSMVAPSPDWFIAINSLNLRSGNPAINNGWKDTFTMDVFAYDAGTDNGSNYTSSNSPNVPVAVSMISGFPVNGNKMATITFTYNSSTLSTSDFTFKNGIEVFPNPVSDVIHIKNSSTSEINSVTVFNVLGNLVSKTNLNSNQRQVSISVSNLNSGVYLARIEGESGQTITKKLVIQ